MQHRDADYSYFADYPPVSLERPEPKPRPWRRIAAAALISVLAVAMCSEARAIPGSTQNPDGSWTGPNGEDLGGGDLNHTPALDQSHEGDPVGVLRCGCGYVVVLRKGVSVEAAREACDAAVPAEKECAK